MAHDFGSKICSGFLTKKGAIFTSWKRRYFVLRDKTLTYYVAAGPSENGDGHPLGHVLTLCYHSALFASGVCFSHLLTSHPR